MTTEIKDLVQDITYRELCAKLTSPVLASEALQLEPTYSVSIY